MIIIIATTASKIQRQEWGKGSYGPIKEDLILLET